MLAIAANHDYLLADEQSLVDRTGLFRIEIVDAENGWPVPAVELRTTHQHRFLSDNAGVIAFDLPELMGREIWLSVHGEGYSVKPDGFGFRGFRVRPAANQQVKIAVFRQLPGKRLGRLTGAGLFAESQRFGEQLDWQESGVLGCDSIQLAVLGDRILWNWGDTTLADYPLGLFHMSGATTSLAPLASFEPPLKLRLDYFRDAQQKPRVMALMPGPGPTWLGGYVLVRDKQGKEHLMATYERIKPPLSVYEVGFCEWNFRTEQFEPHSVIWKQTDAREKPPQFPTGHVVHYRESPQQSWLLFGHGVPDLKVAANYEALVDRSQWIALPGATASVDDQDEASDSDGAASKQAKKATVIQSTDGQAIKVHRGSIAWNDYLQRWLFVFTQLDGETSMLGEVWAAVSDSPLGPFEQAVHVVTHDKYTFYNVRQHSELTQASPQVVLFEGTYTNTFSGNSSFKPRHDYNQVMYRLDLNEKPFAAWRESP